MATKRNVILQGPAVVYNEEGVAGEAIKPGYLVKGVTALLNQTSTGKVPLALACERSELGAGIDNAHQGSGTGSAYYASGDTVKVAVCPAGTVFLGFVASGQNIVKDDLMVSAGDGTFAEGSSNVVARSLESPGVITVLTAVRMQAI